MTLNFINLAWLYFLQSSQKPARCTLSILHTIALLGQPRCNPSSHNCFTRSATLQPDYFNIHYLVSDCHSQPPTAISHTAIQITATTKLHCTHTTKLAMTELDRTPILQPLNLTVNTLYCLQATNSMHCLPNFLVRQCQIRLPDLGTHFWVEGAAALVVILREAGRWQGGLGCRLWLKYWRTCYVFT